MAQGIKSMNLRFSEETFAKLKELKEVSGAHSWEEWITKMAGIDR